MEQKDQRIIIDPYFKDYMIFTLDDLMEHLKEIKKKIRNSKEYRKYLAYIKEEIKIRSCDFFKEFDAIDNDVDLEMHHIISLEELVVIVGSYMVDQLKEGEYLLTFDIAKEVMKIHFEHLIPVVMLTKTIHQMYHSGLYAIDKESKSIDIGLYKIFASKYGKYFDINVIETYNYYGIDITQFIKENDNYEEISNS